MRGRQKPTYTLVRDGDPRIDLGGNLLLLFSTLATIGTASRIIRSERQASIDDDSLAGNEFSAEREKQNGIGIV